jgi:hypothetical protein
MAHTRAAIPTIRQVAVSLSAGWMLFNLICAPDLAAQVRPIREPSDVQTKDAAVQASMPSDVVTIPDGAPLTLSLEEGISSAWANVGETVKFTTPYPVRANGFVILPAGASVSGTIEHVSHSHKGLRDGEVKVRIDKLLLPTGELATLRPRKSASHKSKSDAADTQPTGPMNSKVLSDPQFYEYMFVTAGVVGAAILTTKGEERQYAARTRVTVYFNGPLNLNRAALQGLQPPPYAGPAQVVFTSRSGRPVKLYCGHEVVGDLFYPLQLELTPGTYSFNAGNAQHAVRMEVEENHQYWIEREHGRLLVANSSGGLHAVEEAAGSPNLVEHDFTRPGTEYSCPQIDPH